MSSFKGSANGNSRIDDNDVVVIRRRYIYNAETLAAICADYDLSVTHTCGIIFGTSWTHVSKYLFSKVKIRRIRKKIRLQRTRDNAVENFKRFVDIHGPLPPKNKWNLKTRCHTWTGCTIGKGYGQYGALRYLLGTRVAHRISYMLANDLKELDDVTECVLHKCDRMWCCNPKHMFLGDRDDNNQDMIIKGRAAWQVKRAGRFRCVS
jgi:hypothetical protein